MPGLIVAAATGGTGLAATAVREGAERSATVLVDAARTIAERAKTVDWANDAGVLRFGDARKAAVVAHRISNGHAWDKHVIEQNEFPEISHPREFADRIETALLTGEERLIARGRSVHWKDGLIVIVDPRSPDLGSAFKSSYRYFQTRE